MKKVPISYSAESLPKKNPKWLVRVIIGVASLYAGFLIFWLSGFGEKSVSQGIQIITITLQSVLIGIFFKSQKRQSIIINAVNNTILYYSGRKQYRIKPHNIKTVQFTDGYVEINLNNGKMVRISSDNFPKVDMNGLGSYVKSVMSAEGEIKNEFFEHEDSGFHVIKKTVMESPNPWPQVFIILFGFFAVIMTVYWIFS